MNIIISLRNFAKIAFETLTVSTSAAGVGFTAATINPMSGKGISDQADYVILTVAANPIRYRLDGTAPSATVGHYLAAGDGLTLESPQMIKNFLAIRDTTATGDAVVSCTYGWTVR
jgi:hypothetical protein